MANKKCLKVDTHTQNYNYFVEFLYWLGDRKGFTELGLRPEIIAKVIFMKPSTIKGYISRARVSGILVNPSKVLYKATQEYSSNEYDVDIDTLEAYLKSQNVEMDAFVGTQMVDAYFEQIIRENEAKSAKRSKNKAQSARRFLKEDTHIIGMGIINKWNDILYHKGLGKFVDYYLEDEKLRATNILSPTWNPTNDTHKDSEDYERLHKRENLLKEFGIEHPVEYDVNGSIYRLTFNLFHEELLPEGVDIYKMMWDKLGIDAPFTKEVRKHFKTACMPIYMKPQSIGSNIDLYYRIKTCKRNGVKIKFDPKKIAQFEAYEYWETIVPDLKSFLYKLKDVMLEVMGIEKFLNRRIFLYESELIALVKVKFYERYGTLLLNAYDGFYGEATDSNWTEENFLEIYEEAINEMKVIIANPTGIFDKDDEFTDDDRDIMIGLRETASMVVLPATITPIAKKVDYEDIKSWDDVLALEKEGKVMYF